MSGNRIRLTRKNLEIVLLVEFELMEIYDNMRDVTAS
jgi:hypothetical protein